MNANHYLIRLIKRGQPVLLLEYASLAGLINSQIELSKSGIVVTDKKVNMAVRIEVEIIQTGSGNSEHVGAFYLHNTFKNADWFEVIQITLLKHRLD